jgi:hypothetical protein
MAGSFACKTLIAECNFEEPTIDLMSTRNVFYIDKGFWAYQKGNDGQTKMQSF